MTPLDGPAWQVTLLTAPDAPHAYLFLRASHVWLDGLSQRRVLTMLFGDRDAAAADPAWTRTGSLTAGTLVSAAGPIGCRPGSAAGPSAAARSSARPR